MNYRNLAAVVLAALISATAIRASAATPGETVQSGISAIISVLRDPALQQPGREAERRQKVMATMDPVFDVGLMAHRVIGKYWDGLDDSRRKAYSDTYKEFIFAVYYGKIRTYSSEQIQYVSEQINGNLAEVKSLLKNGQGQAVAIDYELVDEGGQWRIYDVAIDGIGLADNYRSQFSHFLQRHSLEELMAALRQKTAQIG